MNSKALNSKALGTIAWLSVGWLALSGCNTADQPVVLQAAPQTSIPTTQTTVQVSIDAPTVIAIERHGEFILEVTARLHNPTNQMVPLSAGTPCAVFRWDVLLAGDMVQTEPSQLCIQMVATDTLPPYSSIERHYEIVLDGARYGSGNQYLLRYQFWSYNGNHTFTLADGVAE